MEFRDLLKSKSGRMVNLGKKGKSCDGEVPNKKLRVEPRQGKCQNP